MLCLALLAGAPGGASAFVWPNVPERIARALASDDVAERRLAAERLLELPPELAIDLVELAMGDPDEEVRIRAARAAIHFRLPNAGDRVMPWLSDSDSRLRAVAADVIRAAPTPNSVAALGRVLADPSEHVRLAAAIAMGESGMPDAVSPLLGHLDDTSPEVRAEVARALGRIGDPRAVVPLIGKAQDSSPDVRRTVARALGDLGDDRAAAALMLSLQDPAKNVRVEAVTALGKLRSRDATIAVAQLAREPSVEEAGALAPGAVGANPFEVRRAALSALGRIGTAEAVSVLIETLERDDPERAQSPVREALIAAGDTSIGPLIDVIERTPSRAAAAGAALVLGALEARAAGEAIVKAMQRGSLPRRPGLRALAGLRDPAALPTVLELIDDADPMVRREAIAAAIALLDPQKPDGRAVDPVSAVLADAATPLEEKVMLVELLGRTGAPRASQSLMDLSGSPIATIRRAAIRALGSLRTGSAAIDEVLLDTLGDESAEIRLEAAMALSRVATPKATATLVDRLARAAEQDRGAIGIALSGAMSRVEDDGAVEDVARLISIVQPSVRDALIESLGRSKARAADAALSRLAKSADIDDRRKAAESLGGRPGALDTLRALLRDPDATVRANAVWSAGAVATPADVELLAALLRDPDVAVAGNAAAAVGRLAARASKPTVAADKLCPALSDTRAYVRANAISGLGLSQAVCGDGSVFLSALARDDAESVRFAAATFLHASARAQGAGGVSSAAAERALARCSSDDKSSMVAARCSASPSRPSGSDDLLVFVVPDGRSLPVARAPFALVRADGLLRLGVADRRGALFERASPRGVVRLAVPAALVR